MQDFRIANIIQESAAIKLKIAADTTLLALIAEVRQVMTRQLTAKHTIWFCGNGGSAADAQHLAAELSGRFYKDREPLPAEALHCNTSFLTAVANDYSYDEVYSRLVRAMGKEGDILFALSTSGNSKNILQAARTAKAKNLIVVGMTGESGGELADLCDYCIKVPSKDTPRIQESHILIGHILCELTEAEIFI